MDIVAGIGERLRERADAERAEVERRYLRSELNHLGVPVPAIRKITVASVRGLPREETLAVAERLWDAPVHELRMAAVETLVRNVALLAPADLSLVERLVREARTWAFIDPLAIKVVGELVLRFPRLAADLDRYAIDPDFWVRRTAVLALVPGVKAEDGDLARLSRYGDMMVEEREFFVRKALGWVLRDLSRRDPAWVSAWVRANIARISGVTVREAVRHLPAADRDALLAAYRAGR